MKKRMARMKKNNKGFTLVELIIVIAIIAILAAVIAPQYLSYVEKAREGTDANAIGEIAHAAEIAYVDKAASTAQTVEVEIDADGKMSIDGDDLDAAIEEVIKTGDNGYKFASKAYRSSTVTITVSTSGVATVDAPSGT